MADSEATGAEELIRCLREDFNAQLFLDDGARELHAIGKFGFFKLVDSSELRIQEPE